MEWPGEVYNRLGFGSMFESRAGDGRDGVRKNLEERQDPFCVRLKEKRRAGKEARYRLQAEDLSAVKPDIATLR
jgi:hypothetical protein